MGDSEEQNAEKPEPLESELPSEPATIDHGPHEPAAASRDPNVSEASATAHRSESQTPDSPIPDSQAAVPLPTTAPMPPSPPRQSVLRRVVQWFTRADALKDTQAALEANTATRPFKQHAASALEVGRRLLHPIEPMQGNAQLIALEAFTQATFWSIAARSGSAPASREEAWSALAADTLAPTKDSELLARVFVADDRTRGELSEPELVTSLGGLQDLANRLVQVTHEADVRQKTLRAQRGLRCGVGALMVFVAAGLGVYQVSRRANLANVATWRTSSTLDNCTPETHTCEGKAFSSFFHTKDEKSPWLEYDFGARRRLSRVVVKNRKDCCQERAVPLVLEVSDDRKRWRKVAEQKKAFDRTTLSFEPTSAQYLRLSVPKKTALHLDSVEIYR